MLPALGADGGFITIVSLPKPLSRFQSFWSQTMAVFVVGADVRLCKVSKKSSVTLMANHGGVPVKTVKEMQTAREHPCSMISQSPT